MTRARTRFQSCLVEQGGEEGEEEAEVEGPAALGEGDLQGRADYLKISSFNIFCYLEMFNPAVNPLYPQSQLDNGARRFETCC